VAASTGDVRRALELLRRAVEMAEEERRGSGAPVPRVADITAASLMVKVGSNGASNGVHWVAHVFLQACDKGTCSAVLTFVRVAIR
jgi:hypothetical protein